MHITATSLPQDFLNVSGHIRANVMQVEGQTAVVIVMVTAQMH